MVLLRFFSPASHVLLSHGVRTCSSYCSYLSRFQSWVASKPYTTWIQPLVTRCKKPSEIGCQEQNMDLKQRPKDQTWPNIFATECYRNAIEIGECGSVHCFNEIDKKNQSDIRYGSLPSLMFTLWLCRCSNLDNVLVFCHETALKIPPMHRAPVLQGDPVLAKRACKRITQGR